MKNTVQEYEWGSRTAISELLGKQVPSPVPQAELWMGAHPRGPSMVQRDNEWISLPDLIEAAPEDILGKEVKKNLVAGCRICLRFWQRKNRFPFRPIRI